MHQEKFFSAPAQTLCLGLKGSRNMASLESRMRKGRAARSRDYRLIIIRYYARRIYQSYFSLRFSRYSTFELSGYAGFEPNVLRLFPRPWH